MALLGSASYDPTTAATGATSALLAMTAMDTTNLRITFTAPANGTVWVRLAVAQKGAATNPTILLGVLDGSTIRGRISAAMGRSPGTNGLATHEGSFLVTGLTPSQQYTWDAAYGVEDLVASSTIGWGGPDDAVANNAYGAAIFEIWDTADLLAGTLYDPTTAVAKSTASLLAMTALDTTNLRLTFTAPASGRVFVRLRGVCATGSATTPVTTLLGVLDGSTIRARAAAVGGFTQAGSVAATDHFVGDVRMAVTGLTPSQSYTWDAAYGVENVQASTNLQYGGPDNNTTANDAWGGFAFEIWDPNRVTAAGGGTPFRPIMMWP